MQAIVLALGCHNIFTLLTEKYVDIGSKRAIW
jgi:hypothetical protein